jgi:hypothetical protein
MADEDFQQIALELGSLPRISQNLAAIVEALQSIAETLSYFRGQAEGGTITITPPRGSN